MARLAADIGQLEIELAAQAAELLMHCMLLAVCNANAALQPGHGHLPPRHADARQTQLRTRRLAMVDSSSSALV